MLVKNNTALAYLGHERSYTIPSEITIIGKGCFTQKEIENIELQNVENINEYGFSESNLTSISISSLVSYIGSYCFRNCTRLESIIIHTSSYSEIKSYSSERFCNENQCCSI